MWCASFIFILVLTFKIYLLRETNATHAQQIVQPRQIEPFLGRKQTLGGAHPKLQL